MISIIPFNHILYPLSQTEEQNLACNHMRTYFSTLLPDKVAKGTQTSITFPFALFIRPE